MGGGGLCPVMASPTSASLRFARHPAQALCRARFRYARGEADSAVTTPVLSELLEMLYAAEHPHILDSAETRRTLGLATADLDAALLYTVRCLHG